MHCESIATKNFIGLKPQIFIPANLSTFTVLARVHNTAKGENFEGENFRG